jgi:tetratricopeptide (TPR) repeat protein
MDPIWQQINEAIHRRDTKSVGLLIPKYLRSHKNSPESIYEASEFYRKITDHKNALRILPKERAKNNRSTLSDKEIKLELQLARLLNLFGASKYALRVVERIRNENRIESKIEMVEVYHCNYEYTKVTELLGADFPVPGKEPWHQDWLIYFYLSYALGETNQTELAIKIMEKIYSVSNSPLIQAMTLGFKGRYLMLAGEPKKALIVLLQAQKFYQENDQTADHAVLQTFLGECLLKLRKFSEATTELQKAFKIIFLPAIKPEEWIEIALLLETVPVNTNHTLAPRLMALYGSKYPPLRLANPKNLESVNQIFSIAKIEITKRTKHIDRISDIFWDGKKARIGLDLVDELIYNLIYAGEYGLPQFRLYELLWPEEHFSFDQHQKRLEQLVTRARARGYKIVWKDLHLRLLSTHVTASGRPQKVIPGYSFLISRKLFTRSEVERYFSISNTGAKNLCRDWIANAHVIFEKPSLYRVL